MRNWLGFGSIFLLVYLASCSSVQSPLGSAGVAPAGEALGATVETEKPTDPPLLTRTVEVESAARATSTTEAARPTSTSIPEPPPVICSPLPWHPLDELLQIVSDPYNPPRPGREERHHGVDFGYYHFGDRDTMQGEPVQFVFAGQVASVLDNLYPYGNMVMVETSPEALTPGLLGRLETVGLQPGESLYLLYAHLNGPPQFSLGDQVGTCQALGEVGLSGNTDIPHLHLEMRLGPAGSVFESMRYYDTRATLKELETYELWRTSGTYRHFDPLLLLIP